MAHDFSTNQTTGISGRANASYINRAKSAGGWYERKRTGIEILYKKATQRVSMSSSPQTSYREITVQDHSLNYETPGLKHTGLSYPPKGLISTVKVSRKKEGPFST